MTGKNDGLRCSVARLVTLFGFRLRVFTAGRMTITDTSGATATVSFCVVRLRGSFGLTLIGFRPELKPKGYVFQRPPYDDYRYERRNRLPYNVDWEDHAYIWTVVTL